jgi:integrase
MAQDSSKVCVANPSALNRRKRMQFRRTRYQFGTIERKPRKHGPDALAFRYRERQPDGTLKQPSKVFGDIEQYPTEAQQWKAVESLRLSANPDNPTQYGVSWGALIDRYIATELPHRKRTGGTYRGYLENHIKPKWGDYGLGDLKPFALEQWLNTTKTLDGSRDLSRKTRRHLRGFVHLLYEHAIRWDLVPSTSANPFGKRRIRIRGRKAKKRRSLTVSQFRQLLRHPLIAKEPYRTMVIVAVCTGLRCNELFALRWSDLDWENRTINVSKGFVAGVFDDPKTDPSEAPVPLEAQVRDALLKWRRRSPFKGNSDLVFASPSQGGKLPYNPDAIQHTRLRPAGVDIGFMTVSHGLVDNLGWHTFRHTYETLLDDTGAPYKVQQRLMRHAEGSMETLKYGEAIDASVRKANAQVVNRLMSNVDQPPAGRRAWQ